MLETLCLILGINAIDKQSIAILNYYITQAQQYFLTETNLEVIPEIAGNIIIDLVILMWNKKGSEGLQSENMSGISYTWSSNLPVQLCQQIARYRRITW